MKIIIAVFTALCFICPSAHAEAPTIDQITYPSTVLLPIHENASQEPITIPTTYSDDDLEYIADLVQAEAGGQPYVGKLAVANVVLNRIEFGYWGDTVKRVINAGGQFSVVHNGKIYSTPDEETIQAVQAVFIDDVRIFPEDVMYFQASKSKKWGVRKYYCRIEGHSFYK